MAAKKKTDETITDVRERATKDLEALYDIAYDQYKNLQKNGRYCCANQVLAIARHIEEAKKAW